MSRVVTGLQGNPVTAHEISNNIDILFKEKKYSDKKNMIKDFFEFCRNKNAYMGVNPILNYLEGNNLRKVKNSKKIYPKELSHVPLENEKKLHAIILEHIDDIEIMAMILIKCSKLSLPEVLKLKWRDLEDFEGHIIIKGQKNNVGSFHKFDRPALFEGSYLITEKKRHLLKKYDEDKLRNKEVVPIKRGGDNDTQIKGRLTKYIRNLLIEAGLEPSEISSVAPGARSPGGTGVILLHKHYEYVLRERCGLELDSPEGKYMRGLVPDDTTNIFYRSLSDRVSGIPYFLVIVRRDDFFLPRKYDVPEIEVENHDAELSYTIPSPGPGRRLSISIPKTYLQSGTQITIRSKYGVAGDITFKDYLSADDITEKKLY